MSNIKIFALGGLGENGKNMFCLDIDNKLFILDAGLKYPTLELFGVDSIIPDFTFLIKNKNRIQGIFLSHGHEDHIGAVPKLLKDIKIPVYGTYFTLAVLKDSMKDQKMKETSYEFNTISSKDVLQFGNIKIVFYNTTHTIPESLGMAFITPDGAIVYAPDFTFDQNVDREYKTSFDKLAEISSHGVLCLLSESLGAERIGNTNSNYQLSHAINQAFFKAKGRIIVSTFSTDLYRIQSVINEAIKLDKNIAIIGRRTQRTVDIAINLGYLKVPKKKLIKLKFINETNQNKLEDTVILVAGDRHEPFYMLQRMCKKLDRLIHINESDTVILMTPPVPGTEKIAARTLDTLYRHNTNVIKIDKSILPPSHASSEELKLLYNILKPQYIVPIIGEYRHQYAQRNLAIDFGFKDGNIIVLDNGEVLEINDKEIVKTRNKIPYGDVLVDGILVGDLNDIVLRDRELLAQDGVLLVIGNVDARKRKLLTNPEIVSRGFVYMKDNEELINSVEKIYLDVSKKQMNGKYINWRDYKDSLKNEISKYLYKETKRRPIVIPVIIDTQGYSCSILGVN